MLKHSEIIKKLSVKQKISLLTDIRGFASPSVNEMGVPYVSLDNLSALVAGAEGLTPSRLAQSWDTELVRSLSSLAVGNSDSNLFVTPSPKISLDPYKESLSEDTYLSAMMGKAFMQGVIEGGATPCVDGYYLTDSEADALDLSVDKASLNELVIKPFMLLSEEIDKGGAVTSCAQLKGEYKDINSTLVSECKFFGNGSVMCAPDSADEVLASVNMGKTVLKGSAAALEAAYERYLYLVKSIEDESATPEELDKAYEDGSAISEEMLDNALDRAIDVAVRIGQTDKKAASDDLTERKNIIADTYVLLKNDNNILPVKKKEKVAIIGHMATLGDAEGISFASRLVDSMDIEYIGSLKGYDMGSVRNSENMQEVKELTEKADKVLVFLGFKAGVNKQNGFKLPAAQLNLLNVLRPFKEKVICILDAPNTVDTSFDEFACGLMLAHVGAGQCPSALASVLMGELSPSGKLTMAYYDDADGYFGELKKYKKFGKSKVGPFLGYRYYDSSELPVKYPFGFGKSYTEFKYSGIFVKGSTVSFTLRNTGAYDCAEISQIYIGKRNSSAIRPKKELVAFVKTELKAGESRTVTVNDIDLKIFNISDGRWITEDGDYDVYVGASVSDIRLTGVMHLKGETVSSYGGKKSDYLQSDSNIVSDKFTLEAGVNKMKKFWKLKLLAIISFIGALGLGVYSFLNDKLADPMMLGGMGGLAVIAFVLLIVDIVRKRAYKKEIIRKENDYAKQFSEGAEEKEFDSINDLFVEEFDTEERASEEKKEENVFWDDTSKYIDLGLTVETALGQMKQFLLEKGFDVSENECAKLLSAYSSSRFILTMIPEGDKIFSALAEYFGTPFYCEKIEDGTAGDLLYRADASGNRAATALVNAIAMAKENKEKAFTVLFTNVRASQLFDLFLPYFRYFSNPLRKCTVSVKAPAVSFVLPENLWIAVELADGESLLNVSETALKSLTLLNLDYSKCEASEERSAYKPVGYYQIDYFVQQCRNKFQLKEELWKKVDALEAYTNGQSAYSIGNKQWLQMEKYLSVLSLFEKEDYVALDIALSVNLLPEIMAALNGKIKTGEKTLTEELEQLFGEDKIPMCRKIMKGNAFVGI